MVSNDVLLKLLKKSKSKISLLMLLEKEPYYVRELSTKIKIFPSAILKHLKFLEDTKLIASEELGNKKYYKITKIGKSLLNSLK